MPETPSAHQSGPGPGPAPAARSRREVAVGTRARKRSASPPARQPAGAVAQGLCPARCCSPAAASTADLARVAGRGEAGGGVPAAAAWFQPPLRQGTWRSGGKGWARPRRRTGWEKGELEKP